jgi:hypothetical protein
MKSAIRIIVSVGIVVTVVALWGQAPQGGAASSGAPVSQLKQAMAANRAKLMKYQWVQDTEVNVKGKTRKDVQSTCHYGPDGKVVKTPMAAPAAPQEQARGLKGRVIANKKEEMQDYVQSLKSLISEYVPPNPQMLKAAKEQGNANASAANGTMTLTFNDYYKPGDKVAIGFDPAAKRLVSYDVNTYLGDPKNDIVTMTNQFDSLPDGTNYLKQTVINSQSKQIQITTTNSNYTPVGQ